MKRKSGIFPKVEKNGWTGIAFVNTENQQATVNLKAYNDTGTVLATGTKTLKAHAKWVGIRKPDASSLFPRETNLNDCHLFKLFYRSERGRLSVERFQRHHA